MSDKGWIKIHRKVQENSFCYGSAERLGFWTMLLLMANHQGKSFFIGNQQIDCVSGQFATGRKKLSVKSGVSEMKVERWLSCLENAQQIKQDKFNKYRVITILKWKSYQAVDKNDAQQMGNKRTTDEQQMNTNKNVKNVKNVKNEKKTTGIQNFETARDVDKKRLALQKSSGTGMQSLREAMPKRLRAIVERTPV